MERNRGEIARREMVANRTFISRDRRIGLVVKKKDKEVSYGQTFE